MEENDGAQAQEGVADVKTRISVQERLKDLRVEKGLKLEELAEQVGLSKSALGSYENDEDKEINHGSLLKLADFYQVTVDYLLGLSDNRAHENTPLAELHLTDEAVALLKSGRVNNRLLCEIVAHDKFAELLADVEIYVDGDQVILKKYLPCCIFCGSKEELATYDDKYVCRSCRSKLAKL